MKTICADGGIAMKLLSLIISFLLFTLTGSAFAITIGINPASQTVDSGANFTAALTISGLGDASSPSLGTYDIAVSYDPSIINFVGASYGDPVLGDQLDLSGFGTYTSTTTSTNSVELFELSFDDAATLDALQSNAFTLANLSFNAQSVGSAALGINVIALGDSLGNSLSASLANGAVTVKSGNVSTAPEPASLALLGIGLIGLGVTRKRKHKA